MFWEGNFYCGSGFATNSVAKYSRRTIGIDISSKSIKIAKKSNDDNSKISFLCVDIEKFAVKNKKVADICIANMLLSNVVDCKKTCNAIFDILNKKGHLIITLSHPCFWSEYWEYSEEETFDYTKEIVMSHEFEITGIGSLGSITHIHRPLV